MRQVYPNAGLTAWLNLMVANNLHWHLFTNNATIDRAITLGGLTEAAWAGYALVTVVAGTWTISLAGNLGVAQAAAIAFLNSSGGPVNVYGYYVTDAADAVLLAVGKFDTVPLVIPDTDQYTMIPSLGDLSQATVSP